MGRDACHNTCHDGAGLAHLRSPSFQVTPRHAYQSPLEASPTALSFRFVVELLVSMLPSTARPHLHTDANPPPKFMHTPVMAKALPLTAVASVAVGLYSFALANQSHFRRSFGSSDFSDSSDSSFRSIR